MVRKQHERVFFYQLFVLASDGFAGYRRIAFLQKDFAERPERAVGGSRYRQGQKP